MEIDSQSTQQQAPPAYRRHDLDALRAFAMLLGIALHASMAYVTYDFWEVTDTRRDPIFDQLTRAIHGFRMPLFMVMSGFFTAMLYRRYGLGRLINRRLKRIALPLLIGVFTIVSLFGPVVKLCAWIEAGLAPSSKQMGPWQAIRNDDVDALKKLLKASRRQQAFVNQWHPKFQMPLLNWSAMHGATDCAKCLLNHHATVNIQSGDGSTPLLHAAMMGQLEVVRILLDHDANPNLINMHQATALDATYVGPDTIDWIAGQLKLKPRDDLKRQRIRIRQLLIERGGMYADQLAASVRGRDDASDDLGDDIRPQADNSTVSLLREKLDWLLEANERLLQWPWFHAKHFEHLWFLWHLCLLLIPFVIYALVSDYLEIMFAYRGLPEWLFRAPVIYLWVIPLTWLPQWFQIDFGPDTSLAFHVMPHVLMLYVIFFLFGAVYHDRRKPDSDHEMPETQKDPPSLYWWLVLPIALLLVYPIAYQVQHQKEKVDWLINGDGRMLFTLLSCCYTWMMIFGFMGLFRVIASKERAWVRYLSDSSYWLYMSHLPTMFIFQTLFKHAQISVWLKFILTCLMATGLLLIIYDLCIRYSVIGTVLNGKRSRPQGGWLRFWFHQS